MTIRSLKFNDQTLDSIKKMDSVFIKTAYPLELKIMVHGYFYRYKIEIELSNKKMELTYTEGKELLKYLKRAIKLQNEDIRERRKKY